MQHVFHNGTVHTVDSTRPHATGFVIEGERIVAVGDDAEVLRLADEGAEIIDLDGAVVLPGFVDVHNHHFVSGREELFELTIPTGAGVDGIVDAVASHIASTSPDPGAWIVGSPWASDALDSLNSPESLGKLDAASADRPVVLVDDAHHNRWANSAAMELAGITDNDTGILFEAAGLEVARLQNAATPLTAEQETAASKRAVGVLNSYGITAFQDAAASREILRALASLDTAGELTAWVVSSMVINDEIFGFDPIGDDLVFDGEEFRTHHHRPDFVKIFLDGVPPTQTGAFVEPYLPDDAHPAHHRGDTLLDPGELVNWLRRVSAVGLSAKIHCTGDASVHAVLDAVEILRGDGVEDARFHVAHGQFVLDADIPRMADLRVDADISPFIWVPGPIAEAIRHVLPPERADRMQPVRDQLDAGVIVAGGSDWPVSPSPNPWEGIEGLVTREDPSNRYPGALWPEQAITLAEAIEVFTINGARALGLAAECGSISPGKSADFTIVDRDPFDVEAHDLADIQVDETWFAGRRVFAR